MKLKLFIGVVLLQLGFLSWIVLDQEIFFRSASPFLLQVADYDTRDLIRGHYVALSYPVEQIPASLFNFDSHLLKPYPELRFGSIVYVEFAPGNNGYYVAVNASTNLFTSTNHILKGRVRYVMISKLEGTNTVKLLDPIVNVDYGMRKFYVDERKANVTTNLSASIIARKDGSGCVIGLLVNRLACN